MSRKMCALGDIGLSWEYGRITNTAHVRGAVAAMLSLITQRVEKLPFHHHGTVHGA